MIQRLSAQNLSFGSNSSGSVRDAFNSQIEKNNNTVKMENAKVMNMAQKQSTGAQIAMQGGAVAAADSKFVAIA